MLLGVPKFFTCRSIGLGTLGDLGSFLYANVVLEYGEIGECIVPFHG